MRSGWREGDQAPQSPESGAAFRPGDPAWGEPRAEPGRCDLSSCQATFWPGSGTSQPLPSCTRVTRIIVSASQAW